MDVLIKEQGIGKVHPSHNIANYWRKKREKRLGVDFKDANYCTAPKRYYAPLPHHYHYL
jgi:hypothetical protein